MIRRPPRSTHCISSAASDVYKRQLFMVVAAQAQTPAITMTTTTTIGSTFSIDIVATVNNTTIQIDWGYETLTNHIIGVDYSNVSGTLMGNIIKITGRVFIT
eukprot:TRINITY_DN10979_c0_g1_i2.p3 TRINITY_DN10979_c0_g1~~TRINITY_DN10979_c0_g1_i2.p3  ORF type:complete len:102 (+),score=17.88 TRINITY_DN10979_c0_g1_i2:130-435(+)